MNQDYLAGEAGEEFEVELERYELRAGLPYRFEIDRRGFLKAVGGGLVVVLLVPSVVAQDTGARGGQNRGQHRGRGAGGPPQIGAWVHIGEDGKVTGYTGKVEIGQDTRTALTLVAAEELRVPVERVSFVMGDTDLVPPDRGTWGSGSTPNMVPQIRRAAAAAREALVDLAAKRWEVERGGVTVAEGRVVHPDGKTSLAFGELTKGEKLVQTIGEAPTTAPKDWKVCGKPASKANARDIVTGRQRYASDQVRPGMLHGRVLRPSAFGATIASIDLEKAKATPGVVVVRDGEFVGVAAPDEATAARALAAIEVEWKTRPQPNHRELFEHLKKNAGGGGGGAAGGGRGGGGGGRGGGDVGSIDDGLAKADKRFTATYTLPYIAHAPLETRAALAEWTADGRLEVSAGMQGPFGLRTDLARTFGIGEDKVRVRVPDVGSGYGGKNRGRNAAVEAARLAKAAGKPVKVVWTREEEFTWAYFRPAGVIEVESGVKEDGTLTAWRFHNFNSGGAAIAPRYRIPNQEVRSHESDSPLEQGSYRALAATANHFARETHLDEIAVALKMDPLALRLRNLEDERLVAVLKAAAQRFGWGEKKPQEGRGFGLACGHDKGSYVATCAEVSVDKSGEVRIERVVAAFECGAIIHPRNVENQVEGAIVMGIGGALLEGIEFENGRVLNGKFSVYRVPRFKDAPPIETVLLDRKDLPSVGAGETPIVAIAPAIGNAIFAASGKRHRSLPMA